MGELLHLLPFEVAALRDAAAADVRSRMRRQQALAPAKLRPLLVYLEAHLFDPGFSVARMQRECQVGDKGIGTQFAKAVGATPYKYLEICRHETAERLLRETALPVFQLAAVLGFSGTHHFTKSFERRTGETPAMYRARRQCESPGPGTEWRLREATCERAERGELDAAACEEVWRQLVFLHPAEEAAPAPTEGTDAEEAPRRSVEQLEEQVAQLDWERLAPLPVGKQRALVCSGPHYRTPALFHLLCRKSCETTWHDRERARELAQLSLVCLGNLTPSPPAAELAQLRALGHAWVGHSERLLLDFDAAERSFQIAEEHLEGVAAAPQVEAEIIRLKATFRWVERRIPEALTLINRAIELFKSAGTRQQQGKAFMLRAFLHWHQEELEKAIEDQLAAREVIGASATVHLTWAIAFNLTRLYVDNDQPSEALQYLPQTRTACEKVGHQHGRFMLAWLEGNLAKAQGSDVEARLSLKAAYLGFRELGWLQHAAVAGLDFAWVQVEQRFFGDALQVLGEIIPLIDVFELRREAGVALELLNTATEACEETIVVLRALRRIRRKLEREVSFE